MDADEFIEIINENKAEPDGILPKNEKRMSLRQRYRRTMFFQNVDIIPNFEFGYWEETLNEWHKQGLPPEINNEKTAYEYFGIEDWRYAPINAMGLIPGFPSKIIEDDENYQIYTDYNGCTAKINKRGHKSIPHYIDFKLKDREGWEEYKEKLKPESKRVPDDWKDTVLGHQRQDFPVALNIGSMIGVPRNWIGFENIALMIYDDPELLEEIVETLCELVCHTIGPVVKEVEFDFAAGWEDICFNSGPIVGIDFMRNVVTPRYKRITDLLHKHGCHIAWTDCDGLITPIVDCFLDGGINCMFPVEVNAGNDPVELRKRWPDIRMQGGFCKMVLARNKKAIHEELSRLEPIVREGGFIPGVDHRVQADVPLDNYKYYIKMKREIFGTGGTPQYDESKVCR